jgi:hypothetical protein
MSARFTENAGLHPRRHRGVNPAALGQIHSTQEIES